MLERTEDLASLLRGTMLEGRDVVVLAQARDGKAVFSVKIESPDEVLNAWRTARRLVDQTARWPVVTGAYWLPQAEDVALPVDDRETSSRLAAEVVRSLADERSHAFDGVDGWTGTYRDFLEFHLNNTQHRCGSAPSAGDVAAALPDSADEVALDRWLMVWEERRQPTRGAEGGGHLEWFFDPDEPQLAFTPAPDGPLTLNYMGFWGYEAMGDLGFHSSIPGLIVVLRYWNDRYGAELVANWGTMLQFVVERPPATLEDARDLAEAQGLIAPDTFARAGLATRAHARSLIGRGDWLLHNRP